MRFFRVCQCRILALECYHNLSWLVGQKWIVIYSFVTCFLNVLEQAKATLFLWTTLIKVQSHLKCPTNAFLHTKLGSEHTLMTYWLASNCYLFIVVLAAVVTNLLNVRIYDHKHWRAFAATFYLWFFFLPFSFFSEEITIFLSQFNGITVRSFLLLFQFTLECSFIRDLITPLKVRTSPFQSATWLVTLSLW